MIGFAFYSDAQSIEIIPLYRCIHLVSDAFIMFSVSIPYGAQRDCLMNRKFRSIKKRMQQDTLFKIKRVCSCDAHRGNSKKTGFPF